MRGSDRYCLGPTLMRKRSSEGGREEEDRGGGRRGGRGGWGGGRGRNWKVRERLVGVGDGGAGRRMEEGG